MTFAESAVLRSAVPDLPLRFDGFGDGRRVVFQPVPGTRQCPVLGDDGKGRAHAARPYNCRRFACLIPDKTVEAVVPGGPLGCINAETRVLADPDARAFLARYQRPATAWARRHGWTEDMT